MKAKRFARSGAHGRQRHGRLAPTAARGGRAVRAREAASAANKLRQLSPRPARPAQGCHSLANPNTVGSKASSRAAGALATRAASVRLRCPLWSCCNTDSALWPGDSHRLVSLDGLRLNASSAPGPYTCPGALSRTVQDEEQLGSSRTDCNAAPLLRTAALRQPALTDQIGTAVLGRAGANTSEDCVSKTRITPLANARGD